MGRGWFIRIGASSRERDFKIQKRNSKHYALKG
jgi:hypothetical protein